MLRGYSLFPEEAREFCSEFAPRRAEGKEKIFGRGIARSHSESEHEETTIANVPYVESPADRRRKRKGSKLGVRAPCWTIVVTRRICLAHNYEGAAAR